MRARLGSWIGRHAEGLKTIGAWLGCLLILCGIWLTATLYFLEEAATANLVRLTAHRVRVHELEARRSEKDFLLRSLGDPAFLRDGISPYLERQRSRVEALRAEIDVLAGKATPREERPQRLRELVDDYSRGFEDLVAAYRKRGSREWGLEGALETAFDKVGAGVAPFASPLIERAVLSVARAEQDYLLHRSPDAAARVRAAAAALRRSLLETASPAGARDALELADAYETAFAELEGLDTLIGFDEESGLQKRFRDAIRSVEPVVEEVLGEAVRADEAAARTLMMGLLVTCLIMAALLAMAVFFAQAARLRNRRLVQASRQMEEDHRRLLQSERLAAIGQMVTGLAHESRNAFQRMHACLDMLAQEVKDRPAARDLVTRIEESQDHLHLLYEQVREYAAPLRVDPLPVRMGEVITTAWRRLDVLHGSRDVRLNQHVEGTGDGCEADAFAMEQVFRNILENSLAACPDPVVIDVRYVDVRLEGRPALEVSVTDNGPGLDPEQEARIFDPFFTTKTRGTGLGMSIARRLVEAHGGIIAVASGNRPGAKIIVTIPRKYWGRS